MGALDVIVIGAGPGGSNAASVALDGGLSVAQVDRAEFPRVKPCAGGMTVKACRALNFELTPSLRGRFEALQFNLWNGGQCRFLHRSPVLSMVLRPEFDNRLVEENKLRPGFVFHPGEPVESIEWKEGLFRVRTRQRSLSSRQLIGADGAYSLVNRTFGISCPRLRATAVEIVLARDQVQGDPMSDPCFDFGAIERGYGWVFPKDDHWSVGLYTLASGIKDLKERLRRYTAAKGFRVAGDPLASFEAHLIPLGGYRLSVPEAPVYLVGDAGGFADALTGEGIYHALESGRLAGEVAAQVARGQGSHRRYYRRLWRSVLPDTLLSYKAAGPFYRWLPRAMRILWHPLVWRPLVQGYGRGATLTRCLLLGGTYLLGSLGSRSTRT